MPKRLLCLIALFALLVTLPRSADALSPRTEKRQAYYDAVRSQGKLYILVGLPYKPNVTTLDMPLDPYEDTWTTVGFYGFSLGSEYHYTDRLSVAFDYSYLNTASLMGSIITLDGFQNVTHRQTVSLVNSYNFRRFSLGIGPAFTYLNATPRRVRMAI